MTKEIKCELNGLTCGNCALTISKFLENKGASDIVANSSTGEVIFSINENENESTFFEGLEKLGYSKRETLIDENKIHHHSEVLPYLKISFLFWLPLIAHMFFTWKPLHMPLVQFILSIPPYIVGILYFGKSALRSLKNKLPNMDVLVIVGASAAFIYSIIGWLFYKENAHNYLFFETTASIITLVLAGNYLEEYTSRFTSTALKSLLQLQKVKTKLIQVDSIGKESIMEIDNAFLKINDVVQINTGDKIPLDGKLISGFGLLDESMMTGESLPIEKNIDDHVLVERF